MSVPISHLVVLLTDLRLEGAVGYPARHDHLEQGKSYLLCPIIDHSRIGDVDKSERPRHTARKRRARPLILPQLVGSARPERLRGKSRVPHPDILPATLTLTLCVATISTRPSHWPRYAQSGTRARTSRTGRCLPTAPSARSTRPRSLHRPTLLRRTRQRLPQLPP